MSRLMPYLLAILLCLVAALAIVNVSDGAKPTVRIGKPAQYDSRCGDAYRAVRWYRSRYNEHRQTLGFSLAPPVEQAMNCRRLRERARYWIKAAETNRKAAEKRTRYYTLPPTNDWLTAVRIVQRVYPGTSSWLLSCSSAEGGHGRFVLYGGRSYYPGAEHSSTFHGDMVGGPMQYMWGTFKGHYRRGLDELHARGFQVDLPPPSDVRAWLSPLGQAIAGGWGILHGQRSHWYASYGRGC